MVNGSQQVVVVGSSFAGLTAALELRKQLDRQYSVVVLDRRPFERFLLTSRRRGMVAL
jgi:2-polyprenyl-6-methoxyphenol hydroxylase-like FAD-dependent oxidoreductase